MTTVKDKFLEARRISGREMRNWTKQLAGLPEGFLEIAVEDANTASAFYLETAGRAYLTLKYDKIPEGLLSKLILLADEDRVEGQTNWSKVISFEFHIGGVEVTVVENRAGCRKYKVMEKVQTPTFLTVCGEVDTERYDILEDLGEV